MGGGDTTFTDFHLSTIINDKGGRRGKNSKIELPLSPHIARHPTIFEFFTGLLPGQIARFPIRGNVPPATSSRL